jgi:predicted dehydrogenase
MISETYVRSLQRFSVIEVVACCDLNEERVNRIATMFGLAKLSFEEIIDSKEIGMIINLTNPRAHYALNKRALLAGKHVYSEKVIAIELEEGRELCQIAKEKGLRLGVAPDTFLGGSIQTARYLVDMGMIGEVTSVAFSMNRDYNITEDILPHLTERGGGVGFDVGCYYLTAAVCILGPVKKFMSIAIVNRPNRINNRVGDVNFLKSIPVQSEGILTGALEFMSGVLGSFHMTSENIIDEKPFFTIFGTKGYVTIGDPNTFHAPIQLKKMLGNIIEFPFTHGYTEEARGIGVAEMAWAIQGNRPHRASMEMAFHVFEIVHGMLLSSEEEKAYYLESNCLRPAALPQGYMEVGEWGPTQERALVE